VFMGMGEPLNNYDNVLAAIHTMTDPGRQKNGGFGVVREA